MDSITDNDQPKVKLSEGYKHIISLIIVLFLCISTCNAQRKRNMSVVERTDSISNFGQRFSFHTNVIDWAIAMPNIGVEWDLSGKKQNNNSIAVHVKYRPSTWNKFSPKFVFNVFQVRGEWRHYWRTFTADKDPVKVDTSITTFFDRLSYFRRRHLSGAVFNGRRARDWRAYYVGIYAELDKFTYNLFDNGRMGFGASLGLTLGWTTPIYPLRNGASIDLDLGLSVGARIHSYDKFRYEEETHCYEYTGHQERSFVKYPVLSDAHVAFAYRFTSIGNKVKGGKERFLNHESKLETKYEKLKYKYDQLTSELKTLLELRAKITTVH